jgi:hypothetical protein
LPKQWKLNFQFLDHSESEGKFDPNDPKKKGVFVTLVQSGFSFIEKSYYSTDLNVDEIHEVIPMTEDVAFAPKKVYSTVISNLQKLIKSTETSQFASRCCKT